MFAPFLVLSLYVNLILLSKCAIIILVHKYVTHTKASLYHSKIINEKEK